jgi:beta-carotene hydroxylase
VNATSPADDALPGIRAFLARTPGLVDTRTTVLILAMAAGFPALVVLDHAGVLPRAATFLCGVLLMNLSFTAWHEPAHGNFSASAGLNAVAGFLASLASFYPGYFARRREHLVHHKFQGIPGKDPAYARVQATFWTFPLQLVRANYATGPLDVAASFVPITPVQRLFDSISNVAVLGLVAGSIALGFWRSLLAAWILPRIVIFLVHAYTICFFPHSVPGGGYEIYRVREDGRWLSFLTVSQNLHGIHHKWPSIPWHRYRTVLRAARADLERAGIRIL